MKCHFLYLFAAAAHVGVLHAELAAGPAVKDQPQATSAHALKPGEFIWRPEISPAGPVTIIASLPEQVLYVYRNGVRIGCSSISSGKPGHRTPTGVFTILQKKEKHVSSIYKGASMPYMERLTWGGVALHAGSLPGYPASHGCVRLPLEFARQLYKVTDNGTNVIITDQKAAPGSTIAPGLLFTATPGNTAPKGEVLWAPEKAATGPVSIIVSSADHVVYVYRNGLEIGKAAVAGLQGVKGSYVYTALADMDEKGRRNWLSTSATGGEAPDIKELVRQVGIDPSFLTNVRAVVAPGTTLVLTDASVDGVTRSDTGFKILTTEP